MKNSLIALLLCASSSFGQITSSTGVLQFAADGEIQTGTVTVKAVPVSGLSAWWTWIKTQAQTIAGNWVFNGNLTAGDASGDSLTINAGTVTAPNATTTGSANIANVGALGNVFGPVGTVLSSRYLYQTTFESTAGWTESNVSQSVIGSVAGGLRARMSRRAANTDGTPAVVYMNNNDNLWGSIGMFGFPSGSVCSFTVYSLGNARSISFGMAEESQSSVIDAITPPNAFGVRRIFYVASTWAASTAYSVGDNRVPTTPNGLKYMCISAGTSGGTEPTWPTTLYGTVVDGGATWRCLGANGRSDGKLEFFVTGADPATPTVAASTVSTSQYQLLFVTIQRTSNTLYFSINGETPVGIAYTATNPRSPWVAWNAETNVISDVGLVSFRISPNL